MAGWATKIEGSTLDVSIPFPPGVKYTAMTRRDDGTIFVDDAKCVGCRYCEWACPYSAPQFNAETGHMSKCDLCADYRAEGMDPACVAACPSRALEVGELSELRAKYGDLAEVAPLPEAKLPEPALIIKPNAKTKPVSAKAGQLANPEEV